MTLTCKLQTATLHMKLYYRCVAAIKRPIKVLFTHCHKSNLTHSQVIVVIHRNKSNKKLGNENDRLALLYK